MIKSLLNFLERYDLVLFAIMLVFVVGLVIGYAIGAKCQWDADCRQDPWGLLVPKALRGY